MIGFDEINSILSLYQKHGWNQSRVLLSDDLGASLSEKQTRSLFGETPVTNADYDAVWFERKRKDGRTAWEIRHLSTNPFALCASYPESVTKEEIEAGMRNMEDRLQNHAS